MFTPFPTDQLQQTGAAENKVDMLDVPGKGRCYVYIARYIGIISKVTKCMIIVIYKVVQI